MHLRVHNHYRDDYKDYLGAPAEVRAQLVKDHPWLNAEDTVQDLFEDLDSAQAYSVELVPEVQKAEESPENSNAVAHAMLGYDAEREHLFRAAAWLSGKMVLNPELIREALFQEDGDEERAALRAAGLEINEENLAALKSVHSLGDFMKSEIQVEPPKSVQPGTDSARDVSKAVERGFKANDFKPVNLGGRHSTNSALVKDPESHKEYVLKPGSGGVGPAKGVHEETASQARREAAFYHVAKFLHLDNFCSRAELLILDDKEWVAINFLPVQWRTLKNVRKKEPNVVIGALENYRRQGIIHRWAVADYIVGQPDRHGGNLMIGPGGAIKLIDAGSAFAGHSFDPGNDKSSFIPYYLRYRVAGNFNAMSRADQFASMPTIEQHADTELRRWIMGIDENGLRTVLQYFGLKTEACLARLHLLKQMDPQIAAYAHVNSLWLST